MKLEVPATHSLPVHPDAHRLDDNAGIAARIGFTQRVTHHVFCGAARDRSEARIYDQIENVDAEAHDDDPESRKRDAITPCFPRIQPASTFNENPSYAELCSQ